MNGCIIVIAYIIITTLHYYMWTMVRRKLTAYTDGSCLSNGRIGARAGVGVWFGRDHPDNISEKLEGMQTNQRAEIQAAIRAIEIVYQKAPSRIEELEILTDSNYVVKAMNEWILKWRVNNYHNVKNAILFRRLDNLRLTLHEEMGITTTFAHVSAHTGIEGNEGADQLANQGALLT